MKTIRNFFQEYALKIAFVQAWMAVLGSLYFSEIAGLRPCLLCWYQRIPMYSSAVILAVAILRNDRKVYYYVLPLTIIGAAIAFYQYLLQMTPLATLVPAVCNAYESCSKIDFITLGFVTIPFLSLAAFLVVLIMMVIMLKSEAKNVKRN
ncbi:MAG: disulfide bond formation protein B [Candidatus Curtissbacteria bacterium]|nr:disulfide bond formation protein B [Candidatus Curtissbacteria bacterium]